MAATGGQGVELKITISTTLTEVVGMIEDVPFPEQMRELYTYVTHNSSSGYRQRLDTGVRELTEFTVKVLWDDTEATHAALLTALTSTTAVNFTIADPAAGEVIAFSGFVRRIARFGQQVGAYHAMVTIAPSGAPTIT